VGPGQGRGEARRRLVAAGCRARTRTAARVVVESPSAASRRLAAASCREPLVRLAHAPRPRGALRCFYKTRNVPRTRVPEERRAQCPTLNVQPGGSSEARPGTLSAYSEPQPGKHRLAAVKRPRPQGQGFSRRTVERGRVPPQRSRPGPNVVLLPWSPARRSWRANPSNALINGLTAGL